jgi:DNA-binding NarL/FixJ family response regulator
MATILLVEDEEDTREMLARALEREHHRCVVAGTAGEGLEAARRAAFIDVVVTDVVLEKHDDRGGLRLLGELRKAGIHAPVIVITAYADVEKVKTALNEGAAYLLEKPFRAAELNSVISRVQMPGGGVQHNIEQVLSRASLTDKEREVAKYILEGLSGTEIAERARNSPKTIRQHMSRIYEKCGVSSRAEFFRLVYPH